MDLTKEDSIKGAASIAQDVQVVVNSAGILDFLDPRADTALAVLEKQMDTNVYGLMRVIHHFVPIIERNKKAALFKSTLRVPFDALATRFQDMPPVKLPPTWSHNRFEPPYRTRWSYRSTLVPSLLIWWISLE